MKFIEIAGGLLQPVSNEENILVERVRNSEIPVKKLMLSEREQELAKNLVHRGILTRISNNNEICFIINDVRDIWR